MVDDMQLTSATNGKSMGGAKSDRNIGVKRFQVANPLVTMHVTNAPDVIRVSYAIIQIEQAFVFRLNMHDM